MNIHKNARLTPLGRERIVGMAADGRGPAEIADCVGVSLKTVHKWIERFAAEGVAGLADRSSRPHRLHRPTPDSQVEQIIVLRRQRLSGKAIAQQAGVSPATVSRILRRARLSRMRDLEPSEPVRRYEREVPGQVVSAGKAMERLASHVVLRHLALEIGAVGAVSGHGFHPLKARVSGQLPRFELSASRGALQTGPECPDRSRA